MEENLSEKFITKLEEKYGIWTKITSKFGTTSFGVIAKDLSISASQFSKLIYGTATEGMYSRSIANIDRLIQHETTHRELEETLAKNKAYQTELEQLQGQSFSKRNLILYPILALILALILGALGMYSFNLINSQNDADINSKSHPLLEYFDQGFDSAFDSPYLRESEVQDYCPCSAFEGEWSLEVPFKLPLPGSRRPGLYYMAKQSDLRMRCSNINAPYVDKGKAIVGYEYLLSEIWLDTEQEPLIPKYFDADRKAYTPAFKAMDFEEGSRFKRVAVLHAFNVNNFEIHPDSIIRRAELTGRYISDLDENLAKTYEIDIKHIVQNVLGNLTKTNCKTAPNPYCDPNDLVEEESIISFDCMYTIDAENLGLGGGYPYTKRFRLEKQNYSDNLTCQCE
jgi:hypothetical protein